jgi:aerobic-type carbon monoxide dehydrogenase small subunit (CoxS/CutS family)
MTDLYPIKVTVNGKVYERSIEARLLLSDFLRHDLCLTGTHVGCEHGVCGACTVLLDGVAVRSCLMFAVQANGRESGDARSSAPTPRSLSRETRHAMRFLHARHSHDHAALPGGKSQTGSGRNP